MGPRSTITPHTTWPYREYASCSAVQCTTDRLHTDWTHGKSFMVCLQSSRNKVLRKFTSPGPEARTPGPSGASLIPASVASPR
eukprot:77902-Prymnesium_polylepis.2